MSVCGYSPCQFPIHPRIMRLSVFPRQSSIIPRGIGLPICFSFEILPHTTAASQTLPQLNARLNVMLQPIYLLCSACTAMLFLGTLHESLPAGILSCLPLVHRFSKVHNLRPIWIYHTVCNRPISYLRRLSSTTILLTYY